MLRTNILYGTLTCLPADEFKEKFAMPGDFARRGRRWARLMCGVERALRWSVVKPVPYSDSGKLGRRSDPAEEIVWN